MDSNQRFLKAGMGEHTPIPLAVIGCDFRVASSQWRSRLVLANEEAVDIFTKLRSCQAADGFMELATCNRNEWIVSTDQPAWAVELLRAKMLHQLQPDSAARIEPYKYIGEEAANHIFNVVLGCESLIVGERQIARQFFKAIEIARIRGTSSRIINGLGTIAGRLVRHASSRGSRNKSTRGVHTLACSYLRSKIDKPAKILVVGYGEIGRRVAGLLAAEPRYEVVLCNRTIKPKTPKMRPLSELPELLGQVEAAVICTSARHPVISYSTLSNERNKPLLLIDLGIPTQVERFEHGKMAICVGLDELVAYYQANCDSAPSSNDVEKLQHDALFHLQRFCHEQGFTRIIETVQRKNLQLLGQELPQFILLHLAHLAQEERAKLAVDLRTMLLNYTHQVVSTIKEASRNYQEPSFGDDE